jgi:hypothetical protein
VFLPFGQELKRLKLCCHLETRMNSLLNIMFTIAVSKERSRKCEGCFQAACGEGRDHRRPQGRGRESVQASRKTLGDHQEVEGKRKKLGKRIKHDQNQSGRKDEGLFGPYHSFSLILYMKYLL